jgi:hypothetical protein
MDGVHEKVERGMSLPGGFLEFSVLSSRPKTKVTIRLLPVEEPESGKLG